MSSTTRPVRTGEADFYETPRWCTELIMPHLIRETVLSTGNGLYGLEPAAGRGAIVDVMEKAVFWAGHIDCVDIKTQIEGNNGEQTVLRTAVQRWHRQDFLQWQPDSNYTRDGYDLILTNPPYNLALEFVQHSIPMLNTEGRAAFLLRLAFLESAKRHAFMRAHMPDVYVLPKRPSFTGGATDSCAYAWMVFHQQERSRGIIELLEMPKAEAAA